MKVGEAGKKVTGHGADTDIIVASAKAYVNALNKLEFWMKGKGRVANQCGMRNAECGIFKKPQNTQSLSFIVSPWGERSEVRGDKW